MWNIPLSGMLLYAKSKIPILPIPNRSQFDCMCLINFSTAISISSPKRKTELREQFSHASEGRRALGFLFPLSQGPGAGRPSLDPANCHHLLGLPRCKIPAQPWGWAKGSSRILQFLLPTHFLLSHTTYKTHRWEQSITLVPKFTLTVT